MKNYFPLSFKYSKDLVSMIIGIIIYLVVAAVAGVLIWIAGLLGGWIPVAGVILGWILRIVSIIVEVYTLAGIVILVLAFLKIVK
ncbi:MAG: hypothetical protein IKA99_00090 [Clostridia bacterium]|nr:hypothetical protein [Clostridia bacterium]